MIRTMTVLGLVLALAACTDEGDDTAGPTDGGGTDGGGDGGSDGGGDGGSDGGGGDGGSTEPTNLLSNEGFEDGTTDWLVYPTDRTNFGAIPTGEVLYNSTETFTAYEGGQSLKLWGLWSGWENETPVYQEFSGSAGQTYTFTGFAWMHHDDPLTAAHTYAYLALKFFDSSWNLIDFPTSTPFTFESAADTWTELTVTATAPENTVVVQAAVEFWQCDGDESGGNCWDGNGGVYFDDLMFYEVTE